MQTLTTSCEMSHVHAGRKKGQRKAARKVIASRQSLTLSQPGIYILATDLRKAYQRVITMILIFYLFSILPEY